MRSTLPGLDRGQHVEVVALDEDVVHAPAHDGQPSAATNEPMRSSPPRDDLRSPSHDTPRACADPPPAPTYCWSVCLPRID